MTDDERLEIVTKEFINILIATKFGNTKFYLKFMQRIEDLVRQEMLWRDEKDWDRIRATAWGGETN